MSTDFSQFQETFFEESAEHVETIESGLLELEQRSNDLDLLNQIFRGAHSIKGNAGMFGYTAVGELTHKMENILDRLRNEEMQVTRELIDLLLKALDGLKTLLEEVRGGTPADKESIKEIEDKLLIYANSQQDGVDQSSLDQAAPPHSTKQPVRRLIHITWSPFAEIFQRGLDPMRIFDELARLGHMKGVVPNTDHLPNIADMDPEQCYLSWDIEFETTSAISDVESVFDFVREGSELSITEMSTPSPSLPELQESDDRRPLGELLVEEGTVTEDQVQTALSKQKRLGEILVEDQVVEPKQIAKALQKQQDQQQENSASKTKPKKHETLSIRVDTDKIDKLINLVGELVITQSMITDLGQKFTMSQLPLLQERIKELELNTRDVQERVMSIRMLPIGNAFNRFPRLVRDLAAKNNKKIQLVLSGEETELDKTVSEAIGDPLTHLVRNSADHGIEPPEERIAKGKPELGTIKLNAFHEGGTICVTVEDDGKGLNREKILAKAMREGLITEGESLTDEQTWQLIFRPGFSTADKVTDVSGRGVGMDVVKRNIEELGGTVTVQTHEGQGTRFAIKLPLTLAIIEGMIVRVSDEHYIIPLLSIVESIRPTREQIERVVGKGEVINLRGMYLPVLRLFELFDIRPEFSDPAEAVLVIVEAEGTNFALMVDEIIGQQQVVIKSLEQNFRKVKSLAGATILGDGKVALILDIQGLVTRNQQEALASA